MTSVDFSSDTDIDLDGVIVDAGGGAGGGGYGGGGSSRADVYGGGGGSSFAAISDIDDPDAPDSYQSHSGDGEVIIDFNLDLIVDGSITDLLIKSVMG